MTLSVGSSSSSFVSSSASQSVSAMAMANELLSSQSRPVDDFQRILNSNDEEDQSWLDDYSLKFLGCDASSHQARFRLCPQGACWNKDWMGCRENYGDYAIDMDSYIQALMILWNGVTYNTCNQTAYEYCSSCFKPTVEYYNNDDDANGDDANNDDADAENNEMEENNEDGDGNNNDDGGYFYSYNGFETSDECLYSCLHNETAMPSCYYVLNEEDYFMERYSCGRLEDTDYYLGPYCGSDGDGIYIGIFYDDACTEMVNDGSSGGVDTWKVAADGEVAFTETSRQSLQFTYCLKCDYAQYIENEDNDRNRNNEEGTTCDQLYQDESLLACEPFLPEGAGKNYNKNNNNYYTQECWQIDEIPLPKFHRKHPPSYYMLHYGLPIFIALGLLIASQQRNSFDRAQFEDKKEALVGVHGEEEQPQGVMS